MSCSELMICPVWSEPHQVDRQACPCSAGVRRNVPVPREFRGFHERPGSGAGAGSVRDQWTDLEEVETDGRGGSDSGETVPGMATP